MSTPVNNSEKKKKKLIGGLLGLVGILILVNIAASRLHIQADLTQDSRYTITPATTGMLQKLERPVYITVFLEGDDMPAGYKSLQKSTEELLRRFRDISNNKVDYRFVDPLGKDTAMAGLIQRYRMSGFPVTIANGKKGTTQKMVFPWALISTNGRDWPLMLQESNSPMISRKTLSRSELLLEYNIANAIHQLGKAAPDTIAYLAGNGQPAGYEIYAAVTTLSQYYRFEAIELKDYALLPARYKAVIINRPMAAFSEVDKFKIDQYLLHGGNIFWAIDAVSGSIDSFYNAPQFNALPVELNLNDLFFNYGLRINSNLVSDIDKCVDIPMQASKDGDAPSYPWVYFPILQPGSEHPIVKNMNEVLARFISSIDTVNADPAIKKTVLLTTSKYSHTEGAPMPVILSAAMEQPSRSKYNSPNRIVSLLLEGKFRSGYAARMPDLVRHYVDSLGIKRPLATAIHPGKMIVVSDGDILLNEVSRESGPMDMGMYRFSDYRFDNKAFMLNSLEYLTDPGNLLAARTKSYETSILDAKRVEDERTMWQWINIGVPVALVLLAGSVYLFIRKKRYT